MSDQLKIKLSSGPRSILQAGFIVRGLFILLCAAGAAMMGLQFLEENLILSVISFIASFGLFIVLYRLMGTAFTREYLTVTKDELIIANESLSIRGEQKIPLDEIRLLGFSDIQYTPHPMDNAVVDFTGLAAQEKELQYVIDDGNILLETDKYSLRFGKHLPSWEVEEILQQIETFSGRQFSRPSRKEVEIPEQALKGEIVEEEPEQTEDDFIFNFEKEYDTEQGPLLILQALETPSLEDRAYLNNAPAPTGKYLLGDERYVLVSNGLVYAVRGF